MYGSRPTDNTQGKKSRYHNGHACVRNPRTNVLYEGEALLSVLYELCVTVTGSKLYTFIEYNVEDEL
jgi:hypothetical protein